MGYFEIQDAGDELLKSIMDVVPEEKAKAIFKAIDEYVSVRLRDLKDEINQTGEHSPDW